MRMNYPWIIDIDCPGDPRKGIKIRHITSGNDGDVCNSYVTYHILKGNSPKYCIDIGVDEGWWSFFAASVNSNCTIDSFEPNPVSYSALLPYLENNTQIRLHNKAISDSEGNLPFTIEGGQSHSRSSSTLLVPCTRLDAFLHQQVSLIKIDTEGHDLTILHSLHPYLGRIDAIIFECSVFWYGTTRDECIQKTVDELTFLHKEYKNMYLLSRRGEVEVYIFPLDEIASSIEMFYDDHFQVDILVCRNELDLSEPS